MPGFSTPQCDKLSIILLYIIVFKCQPKKNGAQGRTRTDTLLLGADFTKTVIFSYPSGSYVSDVQIWTISLSSSLHVRIVTV